MVHATNYRAENITLFFLYVRNVFFINRSKLGWQIAASKMAYTSSSLLLTYQIDLGFWEIAHLPLPSPKLT